MMRTDNLVTKDEQLTKLSESENLELQELRNFPEEATKSFKQIERAHIHETTRCREYVGKIFPSKDKKRLEKNNETPVFIA